MAKPHTGSLVCALALLVGASFAEPASAGTYEKTVNFALDQWFAIDATDGPCTIHRIRLVRQGGFTKSRFMRPMGSDYLADVQIQIEFTNDATADWETHLELEWLDAEGKAIDGFRGNEGLDSESRHEDQTVTLSTLKYGLERAKTIRIKGTFDKE